MSRQFVKTIEEQNDILMHNVDTMLKTCRWDFMLCGMPVWKHVYHLLHSMDRWFINPRRYAEPAFHEPGLNSLDVQSSRTLGRDEMTAYFKTIREKIAASLGGLTDEMLAGRPEGCEYTRLTLILGQYRHICCHLGNINAVTILQTGKWPRVVGLEGGMDKGLYEE